MYCLGTGKREAWVQQLPAVLTRRERQRNVGLRSMVKYNALGAFAERQVVSRVMGTPHTLAGQCSTVACSRLAVARNSGSDTLQSSALSAITRGAPYGARHLLCGPASRAPTHAPYIPYCLGLFIRHPRRTFRFTTNHACISLFRPPPAGPAPLDPALIIGSLVALFMLVAVIRTLLFASPQCTH